MRTRTAATLSTLTLVTAACAPPAGQDYPDQAVEIIVPFEAGGATDAVARSLAEHMEEPLGESVLVVNRPGGAAAIGATEAASAEPDGHTVFLATGSAFATTPLLEDVSYSEDDFQGVIGLVDQPYLLVADPSAGWESLDDVAETDEELTYGVTGTGNPTHLAIAGFLDDAGVSGEEVPFDDATSVTQEVASGEVDIAAVDLNIAAPQAQEGEVAALGTTSTEPLEDLPDAEPLEEAGYPAASGILSRVALAVPQDTPPDVVDTLRGAAEKARASDGFQEFSDANHLMEPEHSEGDAWFEEFVPAERERAEEMFSDLDIAS